MTSDSYYLDPRVAAAYDTSPELPLDDVPFYVDLAREAHAAGQPVLELACGTGRVTIPIAQTGVHVTGLELSPAMLDIARAKSQGLDNVRWLQADMRDFQIGDRFGLVIIPFRSFLLLLTVADQKACLQRIHDHLLPGGRLALNFFNPDLAIMTSWNTTHRGLWQPMPATPGHERIATRHYETAEQRLEETRLETELSDEGAVISRAYRNLRLRYVFRYEMQHLLELTGFQVEALYGWFDRRPFDDASNEMVWLARKIT